ncbi:MAG: sugar phosphate isomerase/epimerase [Anaerolineae bacterium]|nr:sugar phosphate isomerase/epimerase [Anaerolineae bacterium]
MASTDQVLLSASRNNVEECVTLASEHGLGIEVMAFAYPDVLDGDWKGTLTHYQQLLQTVSGPITVHGPFMDMVSGSPDERINAVCRERYLHAAAITAELGAQVMVLHANFIGTLHNTYYREGWHSRNVEFWSRLINQVATLGVTVVLENMWEFDPTILANLLKAVDHPHLRACLDVGHAHLFSESQFTLLNWIQILEPWLIHSHMNNNNGIIDEHHSFDYPAGVLNYQEVLRIIRSLTHPPMIVLEMDRVADMRESLRYLRLPMSIS